MPPLDPKRTTGARVINLLTKSAAYTLHPAGMSCFLIMCCLERTASLIYILLLPAYGRWVNTFLLWQASTNELWCLEHRNLLHRSGVVCIVLMEPCSQGFHSHLEAVCCFKLLLFRSQSLSNNPTHQTPNSKVWCLYEISSCGVHIIGPWGCRLWEI